MSTHAKVSISRFTAREVKIAAKQGWQIYSLLGQMRIATAGNHFTFDIEALEHVLRNASKNKVCRDAIKIVYQI